MEIKIQDTNRKGFVFTLDAVIGLVIVIGAFVFATALLTTKSESPFLNYEQLHYNAQDSLEVMSKIGTLDDIGAYWAAGNCTTPQDNPDCVNATNIAQSSLNKLMPSNVGYRISFENDTIYENNNYLNSENASQLSIANRVASGFSKGRKKTGYVARAFATKIQNRTTTRVYPFHVSGAGWRAKEFEIQKNFSLPNDTVIKSATLYVSLRYGSKTSSPEFKELKINGNQKKDDIDWIYTQREDIYDSTAAFGIVNATSIMQAGLNAVTLRIGAPHNNSHLHPGMFMVVTFTSNQSLVEIGEVRHKEYFDYIKGDNGVWAIIPYFVPKNATSITASLHLEGGSIENTANENQTYNHTDVEIRVNSDNPIFQDAAPSADPVYNLDLTNYTQIGTNVIVITMNAFGDIAWGDRDTIIKPTSYIAVNYTTPIKKFGFGQIDITRVIEFGGAPSNPKQITFNIPPEAEPLFETFVNIAQAFVTMDNITAWYPEKPESLAWKAPSVKAVPTRVYVDPDKYKINSTNYAKITDFNKSGDIVTIDKIIGKSNVEYTFLASINVPYGEVFDIRQDALDDAIERLEDRAEALGIDLSNLEISNETVSVGGIPTLWGPSRFTLEVWQ
ncbi:TPA: hypothetical protein H1016_02975 [archaeon]|uniref:Uncharacterized protein n=1 Tax=Candidatus Naiadarchaeum limnaeum TaxID=2756139 RepID=A0A832UVI1_9ARCH|nr:hypothetical protein [Candidatus Naiadarchaeum limnaeum]